MPITNAANAIQMTAVVSSPSTCIAELQRSDTDALFSFVADSSNKPPDEPVTPGEPVACKLLARRNISGPRDTTMFGTCRRGNEGC